jgi:hypothetical protein
MIDKTLLLPPDAALWFHAKEYFWLYLYPLIMGFVSVLCMQVYMRVGQLGGVKARTAFLIAAGSAMVNLWGWAHMARTPAMIPFYGCGVGLMAALMTRVHALVMVRRWGLRMPKVIWNGTTEAEGFRRKLRETRPAS